MTTHLASKNPPLKLSGKKNASIETFGQVVWERFKKHQLALVALGFLAVLCLLSFLAPLICKCLGVSAEMASLEAMNLGPCWPHLLGTNELGQDLLAKLLYGGRISLSVGIISAVASSCIGAIIGILAGYYGGIIDSILMRITDAMLSIPVLPLMIVFAAIDMNFLFTGISSNWASVIKIITIIVFFGWMTVARLARTSALQLKSLEFITAAKALGANDVLILIKHILPNSLAPIIVTATLEVGGNILYEASLSFLGLGIQPPVPSWGNMLNNAIDYIKTSPGLAFWPGFFILITVTCFNFLGDGMRDAIDPHQVMKNGKRSTA